MYGIGWTADDIISYCSAAATAAAAWAALVQCTETRSLWHIAFKQRLGRREIVRLRGTQRVTNEGNECLSRSDRLALYGEDRITAVIYGLFHASRTYLVQSASARIKVGCGDVRSTFC